MLEDDERMSLRKAQREPTLMELLQEVAGDGRSRTQAPRTDPPRAPPRRRLEARTPSSMSCGETERDRQQLQGTGVRAARIAEHRNTVTPNSGASTARRIRSGSVEF